MRMFAIVLCTVGFAIGCAKDPSKDVTAAKVSDAKKETPTQGTKIPTQKAEKTAEQPRTTTKTQAKKIPLGGSIVFIGSKVTGSHTNRFNQWSGEAVLGATPSQTTFKFTVQTSSAEADYLDRKPWSGKLQKHLLSADFFDVAKFPTATFESTAVRTKADDPKWTHTVEGKLTIRGVTKQITFPAKVATSPAFSAQTEFSINRKDFGIIYKGRADDLVRDGVVLKIDLTPKT